MKNELVELFQMDDLQQKISGLFQNQNIDIISLITEIASGEMELSLDLILQILFGDVLYGWESIKSVIVMLLVIGIAAAVFANFSSIFKSSQVADIGHYLLYLLLIMVLLRTSETSLAIVQGAISNIIIFIQMVIPIMYIAIGMSGGIASAYGFYQIILLIILSVEAILMSVVIPAVYCYIFLTMINGLMDDNRLEIIMNLLEKMIKGGLKILLVIVTGASVLQSLISPVIDGVKTTLLRKSVTAIPGLGNIADSVSEVLLGSTILIKNSIGVVFLLLLIALCLPPILNLLIITFSIKITGAILSIVGDSRITKCIDRVGEGNAMLLKTLITSISLFVITIAIVTASTSKGY